MSEAVILPLPADSMRDAVEIVERDLRRVVLIRNGAPVAAVISLDDLRTLEDLDAAEDAYWSCVATEATALWQAEGRPHGIPMEDIARELGIDLSDPL